MKYKAYFRGSKCISVLKNDKCILNMPEAEYEYIDLSDYIDAEETEDWVDSSYWEYEVTNNSDRPVHFYAEMQVADSSYGVVDEETFDNDIAPDGSYTLGISSTFGLISHASLYIEFTAENAERYIYRYNY